MPESLPGATTALREELAREKARAEAAEARIVEVEELYATSEDALTPAAAPAAPHGTCANFWHPGHGHELHVRREAVGDPAAVHVDHVNDAGCLNWKPRDSGKEPAKMDTPQGPTCWCGRFSKHESGWCGEYNCERSR